MTDILYNLIAYLTIEEVDIYEAEDDDLIEYINAFMDQEGLIDTTEMNTAEVESNRITQDQIIEYEVSSSRLSIFYNNNFLASICAQYLAKRANRKYAKYIKSLDDIGNPLMSEKFYLN